MSHANQEEAYKFDLKMVSPTKSRLQGRGIKVDAAKTISVSLGLDIRVDADVLSNPDVVEFLTNGTGKYRNQLFMRGVPLVDISPTLESSDEVQNYLEEAHGNIPVPITVIVNETPVEVYEDDFTTWSGIVDGDEVWFLPLAHKSLVVDSMTTIWQVQGKAQLEPDPFDMGTVGLNANSYQDALMIYRELGEPEQTLNYSANYLFRG